MRRKNENEENACIGFSGSVADCNAAAGSGGWVENLYEW
jgi:hypothetical protein